jgi:3-hydroxyisobutyryl-CoA hydrolase
VGLGAAISMYSPFRIVTENTKYAMPETAVGLFCDGLSTHYLSKFDVRLAKYITMTSTVLKGKDTL